MFLLQIVCEDNWSAWSCNNAGHVVKVSKQACVSRGIKAYQIQGIIIHHISFTGKGDG